jgi:hypothetical protein
MYKKAVQTQGLWAVAYDVPMGGYALHVNYIGIKPVLEDEPEFACLEELETVMQEIAPLPQWNRHFFDSLMCQQN